MRICETCGRDEKQVEFVPVGNLCKECKSAYDKEQYQKNREKRLARAKTYGKTEEGRKSNRKASQKYASDGRGAELSKEHYERVRTDPDKYAEHLRVKRAQNNAAYHYKGKVRPCEECGSIADVQKHHDDYDEQLNVRWLCQVCHGKLRRQEVVV